jgi:hypothetical protein
MSEKALVIRAEGNSHVLEFSPQDLRDVISDIVRSDDVIGISLSRSALFVSGEGSLPQPSRHGEGSSPIPSPLRGRGEQRGEGASGRGLGG